MTFRILIQSKAKREILTLPKNVQNRIRNKISEILKQDPYPTGHSDIKKIKGSKYLRLRIGDYRVFYEIEIDIVFILAVRHRSKAYREL